MPRHEPRRDNRERADYEIEALSNQMHTYEETAAKQNENFEWKRHWMRFFEPPVPNKIHEIECVDKRPFSTRKSPFFIGEFEKEEEERAEELENRRRRGSIDEQEEEQEEEHEEQDQEEPENWKMWECYVFCAKQLFWSRVWIFVLQFVASFLAGNRFKTNAFNLADRMNPPGQWPILEAIVKKGFAGLRRWDAQHFLFIADNHYIFEQSLAFFPGFPEIVNIIRMATMYNLSSKYGVMIPPWVLTGLLVVVLNAFFFMVAGCVLFMVSLMVTRNVKRALLAVSLLAFNPASIFFSAAYSESMYFALTLTGFSLQLFSIRTPSYYPRLTGAYIGATVFGLSLVCRSNGLLNVIFVAWYWCGSLVWETEKPIGEAHLLQETIAGSRNERYRREASQRLAEFRRKRKEARKVFRWTDAKFSQGGLVFATWWLALIVLVTYFTPYIFMSNSLAAEFCDADAKQKELVGHLTRAVRLPSHWVSIVDAWNNTSWCRKEKLMGCVPDYYGPIQAKYWNVGWFGYWKLKKIPCFLMMLPAAVITVNAILATWRDVFQKKKWYNIWVLTGRSDHLLPMAIHAAILLFTAIFYINSEVFTRIIFSSGPFLYIYLAGWIDEKTQGNVPGNRMWHYESTWGVLPFFIFRNVWNSGWHGKALYIYFVTYFVLGTMAHAAWLPFT